MLHRSGFLEVSRLSWPCQNPSYHVQTFFLTVVIKNDDDEGKNLNDNYYDAPLKLAKRKSYLLVN